jgi:aminoglycoside phosphotransferase (APT) family kinase protein
MWMHFDQLHIDVSMVRRLIDDQFAQWRDQPVSAVVTDGTTNAIFRIGSDLCARFPLQGEDAARVRTRLEAQANASRYLASCSTVATPTPIAIGNPGHGYPPPWAVQTWIPGEGRGGSLPDHDGWMNTCFHESETLLDVDRLRQLWAELRKLPEAGADVMSHGDLIPANLLVHDGRLVGVLDCGGFGPADPAPDLVVAWHLFNAEAREVLRQSLARPEHPRPDPRRHPTRVRLVNSWRADHKHSVSDLHR